MKKITILLFLTISSISLNAQDVTKKISLTSWDGVIVAGLLNNGEGGFVNFGGPAVKLIHKPMSFSLGMVPGLRYKEDVTPRPAKKNSEITPSLGFALTFAYKHIAIQVPMYFTPKSASADGKWNPGIGIGYKF